jgi:hypothetical protein
MRQQGKLDESLGHHEQQLALAQQLERPEDIAAAYEQLVQARSMLAEFAAESGQHDEATTHLQAWILCTDKLHAHYGMLHGPCFLPA